MASYIRQADALAFTSVGTSYVTKQGLTRPGAVTAVSAGVIRAIRVRRTAGTGTTAVTVTIWDQDDTIANGARILVNHEFTGILAQGSGDANVASQSGKEGYEVPFTQQPFVSVLADTGSGHGYEVIVEYSDGV